MPTECMYLYSSVFGAAYYVNMNVIDTLIHAVMQTSM